MFGNLFNENSQQSHNNTQSSISAILSPPRPRLACGLAGIDNQGATCYLNSLLQTLFLTPEFRDRLFNLTEKDLGCLTNRNNPNCKVRVIPLQLQRLFTKLLLSDQQSVSSADLTNSFGWTNREEFQQHDVQELNRILFSAIEESLVGTSGQSIINELYHGTIVNQITCTKCRKISGREEDFLDLTLAVAGIPGLEAALKQCYCEVEMMDGRNQYKCDTCKIYTDATKGAKLRNLPPVLTLSLLRFSFDLTKMTRYKENGRFTFPFELDMGPYSEKGTLNELDSQYELFSVVVHRGSAFGGHYFAYIRDIDDIGHWTPPENTNANCKVDPNTTGLDVIECQSPVDLIENILGKVSHTSMSVDKLCAEITKVTGVAWNKRFRKSHGPINKFLKSCDSFEYNPDSNWVSLRASGVSPGQESSSFGGSPKCATDKIIPVSDNKNKSLKKTEDESPASGYRWFCFNDSSVYPVNTKDIEKQFSGKESAYMLFYRKKSLYRPKEAQGLASYNIPDQLIEEVQELNAALEQQRQEYDIAVNKINVKIFLCTAFIFNDILQLKPDSDLESAFSTVEIDRRMAFKELKLLIREIVKHFDVNLFTVYRMRAKCGGFHLYEELTDDDMIIQSMGINSDTYLFINFGAQLNESFSGALGEHCEPVQFLIKTQEDDTVACVTLAKNRTLSELYQLVSKTVQKPVGMLQKIGSKNIENVPDTKDTTIQGSELKDGDVLLLLGSDNSESLQLGNKECKNPDSSQDCISVDPDWSITLQSRLFESYSHTCKTITFKSRSTSTVIDIKLQALHLLNLENISAETVRLREDHKTLGLQPPLREGLSMVDAGLNNGVCLVLESGRSPQDSEMTVNVGKVIHGKLLSKKEFLVNRQLTVLGMLQTACKQMECGSSPWYLSKTDMYGDSVEPLDDPTLTLMDALINDGDTLILQQGNLLKKDQIALTLWLAPTVPVQIQSEGISGSGDLLHRREQEDKVMLELAAKLSLSDDKDVNPLTDWSHPNMDLLIESLVISKNMSVDELKQALMDFEGFKSMRIPTGYFMRLRLLDSTRPRAVLRSNSQVLKHVGPRETIPLAVQILNCEENLGVHEVLLMIAQKIGSTRIYMPPREFIWNTSSGMGAGDLKKAIATRLSLPLHDVAIAKYNHENFTWVVLRDQPQKANKNKAKRKNSGHKTNVRQAPYYVQDGDLIGVKLLSLDKGILDADDFATQEDLNHLQQLQLIAEEKKRLREEKKLDSLDCFTTPRRQEVPLTIKVDKFS